MRHCLAGNCKEASFEARNVREVINELDRMFPGIKDRLVEDDQLRPSVVVAVDGETSRLGLLQKIDGDSEIHFIPSISGG